MELIFGEGTDGDCEAAILEPLARGSYIIDIDWNDVTGPAPGGSTTAQTEGISNADGGTLFVREIDPDDGSLCGMTLAIPVHHITRLEIH